MKAKRAWHVHLMTPRSIGSSRGPCCWHIGSTTPAMFWALTPYLDFWDGWPTCCYRFRPVTITQRKAATITQLRKGATSPTWPLLFCRAVRFAVFHLCTILLTLASSLSMGIVTGKSCIWKALATLSRRHSAAMEDRGVKCTQQRCLFFSINALHLCSKGSYSSGTFGDHPRPRNVLMIRLSGR